jgi:hypothetical protein
MAARSAAIYDFAESQVKDAEFASRGVSHPLFGYGEAAK